MLSVLTPILPSEQGLYALWLHLPHTRDLMVGRLGCFEFPAGDYIYLGSARGPGGLRARLGRHLRGGGKLHWHIDYLRAATRVRGFGYVTVRNQISPLVPTECTWNQLLIALPDVGIPIHGFGAGDCRSGCMAHLVHFSQLDAGQISSLLNCEIHICSNK